MDPDDSLLRSQDHPRMRGEHPREMREQMVNLGSSPHARGARRPQ